MHPFTTARVFIRDPRNVYLKPRNPQQEPSAIMIPVQQSSFVPVASLDRLLEASFNVCGSGN